VKVASSKGIPAQCGMKGERRGPRLGSGKGTQAVERNGESGCWRGRSEEIWREKGRKPILSLVHHDQSPFGSCCKRFRSSHVYLTSLLCVLVAGEIFVAFY